jgi:hypothetical protein
MGEEFDLAHRLKQSDDVQLIHQLVFALVKLKVLLDLLIPVFFRALVPL